MIGGSPSFNGFKQFLRSHSMSAKIPDYYQSLVEERDEPAECSAMPSRGEPRDTNRSKEAGSAAQVYRADGFQLALPSADWCDGSTYTLHGPRLDGISHNVTIKIAHSVEASDLGSFAEACVDSLLSDLGDSRKLVDDEILLHCGLPAHRVILAWTPPSGRQLYQEQLYVLHEGRGFTLTAAFTQASRKRIGEEIEQLMLGFQPIRSGAYRRS